jgi:D-isomer specific 2-hydroxyacid dehydrogenase, catalytic domain
VFHLKLSYAAERLAGEMASLVPPVSHLVGHPKVTVGMSSTGESSPERFVVLEPEGTYEDTSIELMILGTSLSQKPFEVCQAHLGETMPYSDLPRDLREQVNGLFVFHHWVSAADVALFPKLKVVVRMGVGYDRLDRKALAERGVKVCNCPGKLFMSF